ncbi:MAG: TIGR02281 family clan AA aspartic protease [Rhodobiaceae bacterium]|nr:TIGR02281 family clan AA aspartic protease [Rhodobiaceae bacterium]MCC0057555.1 TIGR02281 family clan AA aspartic protease [Rhodobiaceae bacterium]
MRLFIIAAGFAVLAALAAPLLDKQSDAVAEQTAAAPRKDQVRSAFAGAREEISRHRSGHYYTEATIDGRDIAVLVDTGASSIALTYEDAERIGLSPARLDYNIRVQTANGEGRAARVVLSRVSIGSVTLRDVNANVAEKGMLGVTLLGMSFLGRLSSFSVEGDRLVLKQ